MKESINRIVDLVGKEVQIYPGDTYEKWGTIVEINNEGILFQITKADKGASTYEVGSYRLISYSANLIFKY